MLVLYDAAHFPRESDR